MASGQSQVIGAPIGNLVTDLKKLVWGTGLKNDIFQRWLQGFTFSDSEATALVQFEGGCCAVLAPVQAFIMKNIIFDCNNDWRLVEASQSRAFLVKALGNILQQCDVTRYFLVVVSDGQQEQDATSTRLISVELEDQKSEELQFHSNLRLIEATTMEEMIAVLNDRIETYTSSCGVLAFLYSVLLTKGIDQIKNEMEDTAESLIHGIHGHGSQSLINLMLTGRAVSNVWDNDQDISGLKLLGINKQSSIGFLTVLEHFRYCEVGWFLKSPLYPIWVLGSETHLTVFFTAEKSLCSPETPEAKAKRVFKSFDPEGNGFISAVLLEDVLQAINLCAESDYVDMMRKKFDSEGLGIILLNDFIDEYFPNEEKQDHLGSFHVYHYNGLKRSCPDNKVTYQEGTAVIYDFDAKCVTDVNPVMTCLQTKWPGLEINWTTGISPSLN